MLYIDYPSWLKPEIIPGLPIRWYALMYLVAFGITYLLFRYQVKKRGLNITKEETGNFFTFVIISLLIGARILGTLGYDPEGYYWRNPWMIFWPFRDGQFGFSGLSYHGGLIGALVGGIIYARWKKVDLVEWSDMVAFGVPLGYTFGRLGNFINGELYGRVTTAPWGVLFPNAAKLPVREAWVRDVMNQVGISNDSVVNGFVNLPRHPSQLYEAFSEGILIFLIFWIISMRCQCFKGFYLSMYIILYGLARFIVEYFRTPDKGMDFPIMLDQGAIIDVSGNIITSHLIVSPWNFTTGQIYSFLMIVGGLIAFFFFKNKAQTNVKSK